MSTLTLLSSVDSDDSQICAFQHGQESKTEMDQDSGLTTSAFKIKQHDFMFRLLLRSDEQALQVRLLRYIYSRA